MQQYDEVARNYDERVAPRYEPIARALTDRLPDLRGKDVLEVGAGTGLVTAQVATRGGYRTFVASDISPGMLAIARTRVNGQVEFLVADLLKLPLPDASVDVVLSGLTPLQDTVEAMREITRVLRPGGTLLVSLWGDDYAELRLLAEVRERLGLGSYPSGRRAAALERTRQAGLTIVATDDLVLPVRHASVEVYLNYRLSFGWAPWMVAERKEEYLRVLRERIEAWAQPDGSVALDWAITILTARRA